MGLLLTMIKYSIFGGSLVIKAEQDQQIKFIHSRKPPRKVIFEMEDTLTDEGKPKKIRTIIDGNKHNLAGTPKPIHICVAGVDRNINLIEKYKADKDAEAFTTMALLSYQAGFQARDAMYSGDGMDYNKNVKLLGIGIIVMMVINIVMMWQVLDLIMVAT